MPQVARARWPAAVLCAAWVVAFSWDEPRGVLVAVPFVLVGALLLPRRLGAGVALVVAAGFVTLLAGASWGNVDMMVPLGVTLFALGRVADRWQHGLLAVGLSAVGSAMREGLAADKLAITLMLFGAMWGFGLVVRRRALQAHAAVAAVAALAEQDPALTGARRAVEERSRLANEALFALRTAIVGMRSLARDAARSLEPHIVRDVHERGTVAVDELRELLGLLREPAGSPPEEPGTATARPARRYHPPRTAPAVACLLLAAVSAVLAVSPPTVPESLLPVAATYVVAAWAVAARPSPFAWTCLAALTATGIWLSTAYGPRGAGFVLFVVGVAALAGLAWSERDRILRDAERRTGHLQARLDEATSTAVRAERLRLARELHDVASHSVGAMVLQAGAAGALRVRDPERARAALRTVVATGDGALRDVDEMLATLDTGEFGQAARAYAGPGRLRGALEGLAARLREGGMALRMDLGELPDSPALTATTYRVAHEGLANALRHAPGAAVEVVATRDGDSYVVRVSDNGAGTSAASGTGFGLAGLRERVLACDGTFAAGPAPEGGFLLEARLPVDGGRSQEPA